MKKRYLFICLAVISLAFFITGNSLLPITDPVESNYTLTAKEMVLSGNWISPQIYGIFWYDKPIAVYWLLSISYSLFGFTDFAARLPGAVLGTASVVITAWYVQRRTRRTAAALLAAAMLATSLEVWAVSHSVVTDQILFFFTAGTMFFSYIGITEGKRSYMTAAYAMAACSVLTKGPVGIILPGLFLLIFVGLRRNTAYLKRIFDPVGIIVFCLIALPWYGMMYALHGSDFINVFFGLNNVVRATASEHPQMNVWYYYLVLVPVSLLPWTGPCLYAAWKRRDWSDEYIYMAVWALGTIIFYSLMATKYPTYSYIANLPLLLFGTAGITDMYRTDRRKPWTILTGPAVCYWILLCIASLFVHWGNWLWLYIFVPIAAIMVLFSQWQRIYAAIPILITAAMIVIYSIITQQGLVPLYQYRSTYAVLPAAEHIHGNLYFFGDYRTSFVYYSGITAILIKQPDTGSSDSSHRSNAWSKKYLYETESPDAVSASLNRRSPVSILVAEKDYADYKASVFYDQTRLAGQFGTYYLFVNLQEEQ